MSFSKVKTIFICSLYEHIYICVHVMLDFLKFAQWNYLNVVTVCNDNSAT